MKNRIIAVCLIAILMLTMPFCAEYVYAYDEISLFASAKEVVISSDIALSDVLSSNYGSVVIKGASGSEKLSLSSEVSLSANLKLENLVLSGSSVIYANGYALEVASNVTSDSRLTVYGGKKSSALSGNTNIVLMGGLYQTVYGGGNGGAVNGSTNIVFGGNANAGDGINDDADNISPCYVYGGGNNAKVSGKTNVTLEGNAVTKYLVGAGYGANGTATDTNININGGKVMNVYAGARNTKLTNCNTHVTMTGGTAEAIFGGSESASVTGNTYVTIKGGEVTRRVYTGCYNNAESKVFWLTWSDTNYHVIGTTNLTLYPEAKLATGSGLSGTNAVNKGVFSGSRIKSQPSDEKNTIIYMNNSYSSLSGKIGEKGYLYTSDFRSFANYVVKVAPGGAVYGTSTPGSVYIEPDEGNYGLVGGSGAYINTNASITGTVEVTFKKNFAVNNVTAKASENNVTVNVTFDAANVTNEENPCLYAVVFDENGNCIAKDNVVTTSDMTSNTFVLEMDDATSSPAQAVVYFWDENLRPLTKEVRINIE